MMIALLIGGYVAMGAFMAGVFRSTGVAEDNWGQVAVYGLIWPVVVLACAGTVPHRMIEARQARGLLPAAKARKE